MSATNQFEQAILGLIFHNTAAANVGDLTGLRQSSAAGSLFISLHTADPGDTATVQTTSEAAYTGYQRVAVPRAEASWTLTPGNIDNASAAAFPAVTGISGVGITTETITHFGIGTATSGDGYLLMSGALTAPLILSVGISPEFAVGALDITLD